MIIVTRKSSTNRIDETLGLLSKEKLEAKTVSWNDKTLLVTRVNPPPRIVSDLEKMEIAEKLILPSRKAQLPAKNSAEKSQWSRSVQSR